MERVKECVTDAAKKLGYPEMKLEQLEVAASFIEGRDVFSVLPTGFGKSLCYACLPLAFDHFMKQERGYSLVIVVTPLVSIMEDQVATYCSKGLTSICVSGDTSGSAILNDVSQG
ncbi:hypothetical protein EMCRGX_G003692 [Ephydatia muelleri]